MYGEKGGKDQGIVSSLGRGTPLRPTRGRGPHQGLFISVYQPPRNSSRLFGSERILSSVASSLSSLLWSDIHAVGRSSSTFAVRLLFLHLWLIVRSKGTRKRTLEMFNRFQFFLSNYMLVCRSFKLLVFLYK